MSEKTCFVVMGYGVKKLPGTFVKLNLDNIYFDFIKPVITCSGLKSLYTEEAYRGDEVPTTLSINKNFIQSIFFADIVIADISTLNQNAIYELGLRHAMKPKSTIILCEETTFNKYPFFDISMVPQFRYDRKKILSDTSYKKTKQKSLRYIIDNCIKSDDNYIDSPVFDLNLYNVNCNLRKSKNLNLSGESLRELILKARKYQENEEYIRAEKYYKNILDVSFDLDIFSQYVFCRYKKEISFSNLSSTLEYVNNQIDLSTTTNENLLGIVAAIYKNIFILNSEISYLEKARRFYKNGSNFEGGNLYCVRNYCALLLKQYIVTSDQDSIIEYYYAAVHFAKVCLTESANIKRNETNFDDTWYNENIKDLTFIAFGIKNGFTNFTPVTKRQDSTISKGRRELIHDYLETIKIIKGK